jgi:hypothetical protein
MTARQPGMNIAQAAKKLRGRFFTDQIETILEIQRTVEPAVRFTA